MSLPFALKPPPILSDPAFWAVVGMGIGLFLFYRGFGLLRRKRYILNTPRSTVRGAAMGPVEVSGQAAGPYTLISPLSVLNCYYYRAVVWQNQNRYWEKVAEENLYAPFFLDDGTGQLLVDPRGAEMDIPAPFSHEYDNSGFSNEFMPDYIRHFLHRHGISGDCPLKLEEYCILPGDTLFVLGTLQGNPAIKAAASRLPEIRRAMPGFVSEQAADLQRREALEQLDPGAQQTLVSEREAAGHFDLQSDAVLAKGPSRDPFFISWCSEREVVLATAWKAFLYIWVGPAVTLACLWALLSRLR